MLSPFEFLLKKLMETEIAMSRLYHHFSVRFPEAADFWKQMSRDEVEHSKWIGEALEMLRTGEMSRGITTLTSQAADMVIKHVDSICAKARGGEISLLSAYATAYDLENSLLEKKFFSALDLDLPPYKEVRDKLVRATQAHRKKIGEALSAIRSREKVSSVLA